MLEMTRGRKDKLTRYLINADPFLWNLLDNKNKTGRLEELKEMGFLSGYPKKGNPNYIKVNHDLLVEIGIEGILERIVVPKVRALFTADTLDYFRRCWEQGQTPTIDYLRKHGLYRRRVGDREVREESWTTAPPAGYKDPSFVFAQIHTQANFVERWTTFAGLWFEEIEPMLGPDGKGRAEGDWISAR